MARELPRFFWVRQSVPDDRLGDIAAVLSAEFCKLDGRVRPGMSVAITVGSRGLSRMAELVALAVQELRKRGAEPFVIPAMGSHGGATAEGQREMLAGYGVTEASAGCPIRSSMDTVQVGTTPNGCPVHCDAHAFAADGILVFNRVKPHTILRGELGSGLMKMVGIGLGKHAGAAAIHLLDVEKELIPAARLALAHDPVLAGLALVENGLGEAAKLEIVLPDEIEEADKRLLTLARSYLPQLPIEPLDALIVRQMGKNISGTGVDPNVVGMHRRLGGEPDHAIRYVAALDLTEESHGNATGVGMLDLITERLRAKIDWEATAMNCITSGFLGGAKQPLAQRTDRELFELLASLIDGAPRITLSNDTAHLSRMLLSEALLPEAMDDPRLTVLGQPCPLVFDAEGALAAG
ncbi:MAG TPA: lactate racemase domain-containing protein [Dehalococcoidia bacterium]|nr:lactate racemase domain-containing protein [Dehalococcoidia bacterium]